MRGFILDDVGSRGLACVFQDDGETGYFYLYDEGGSGVLDDLHIYTRSANLDVAENVVEMLWSRDGNKCGVVIWERMRGIFNIQENTKIAARLESPDTSPITDPEWLKNFEF